MHFLHICQDSLLQIFGYLNIASAINLSSVCKTLRKIVDYPKYNFRQNILNKPNTLFDRFFVDLNAYWTRKFVGLEFELTHRFDYIDSYQSSFSENIQKQINSDDWTSLELGLKFCGELEETTIDDMNMVGIRANKMMRLSFQLCEPSEYYYSRSLQMSFFLNLVIVSSDEQIKLLVNLWIKKMILPNYILSLDILVFEEMYPGNLDFVDKIKYSQYEKILSEEQKRAITIFRLN